MTGASRGIGVAVAEQLARAGAEGAVGYGGGAEAAAEVVNHLEEAGRRAVAVGSDLVCYKGIEYRYLTQEETFAC